ncbi:hypothetical protein L4X63_23325 [Geomonas sp. Red32]|uniref:hypothetical protein n=1 Tax=Geomonas sp. Red32 TaxID=2912856 RepID=UPI00202CADFB|nr:hypothetical protein [Geomonas sp. Red32]MCM0084512.1 hypothetical protein [Geomonas sp. Red32]
MRAAILILLLLYPSLAAAGTQCHVVEFADRFEAVCVGDQPQEPVAAAPVYARPQAAALTPPAPSAMGGTSGAASAAPGPMPMQTAAAATSQPPQANDSAVELGPPPNYHPKGRRSLLGYVEQAREGRAKLMMEGSAAQ